MSDLFNNGHALLIGAGYTNNKHVSCLPETIQDAQALYKLLTDPGRAGYPPEQVALLTEDNAHNADVIRALEHLAEATNTESTVLIYFSGHGGYVDNRYDEEEYIMLLSDFDPTDIDNTSLPGLSFATLIAKIKSKKMVVIYDCCHAGGVATKDNSQNMLKKSNELGKILDDGRGMIVIAACERDQVSYGAYGANPNSLFTQCLLEALEGKGSKPDETTVRMISVLEYLQYQVPKVSGEWVRDGKVKTQQFPMIVKADNASANFYICRINPSKGLNKQTTDQDMTDRIKEPTLRMKEHNTKMLKALDRQLRKITDQWETENDEMTKDNLYLRIKRKQEEIKQIESESSTYQEKPDA